jgi:hypothetical protein
MLYSENYTLEWRLMRAQLAAWNMYMRHVSPRGNLEIRYRAFRRHNRITELLKTAERIRYTRREYMRGLLTTEEYITTVAHCLDHPVITFDEREIAQIMWLTDPALKRFD